MFKYNILICDDQDFKEEQLKKILSSEFFNIKRLHKYSELKEYLSKHDDIHAIFLDLVYPVDNYKGNKTGLSFKDVREIRDLIKRSVKLIIYTRHTSDNIELLRNLAFDDIVNDWVDYDELTSDSHQSAILRLEKTLNFKKNLNDGLWLMHLSDLHFGKQYEYAGGIVKDHLHGLIKDQLDESLSNESFINIKPPQLLVISGDCTNTGSLGEYKESLTFLKSMEKTFESIHSSELVPIIIAPGNHDFQWRISIINEHNIIDKKLIDLNDDKDDEFCDYKWFSFNETFKNYLNKSNYQKKFKYWNYDLSGRFDVRIIVYNTSYNQTYKSNKIRIVSSDIEKISEELSSHKTLTIFVMHHPVDMLFESDEEKTQLLNILYKRLNVRIILSGHKHEANMKKHNIGGSKEILEIQTGSTAARDILHYPNYRMIQISKNDSGNWKYVKSWTFENTGSNYIPKNQDSGGRPYEEQTICELK